MPWPVSVGRGCVIFGAEILLRHVPLAAMNQAPDLILLPHFRFLARCTAGVLLHALLLFSLCAGTAAAQGTDLAQLYSGEVMVGEQAAGESQLVRAAFVAMLVKLTGERQPLQIPGLADGLGEAAGMASRVGFVAFDPPSALRPSLLAADGSPAQRLFRASFSAARVDQWLRVRQIPRWSPERATMRAWFAYEQEGQRRLITDYDDPLRWWLQASANQRGLPLEWPQPLLLFDPAVYQQAVAATWGGFHEDLPGASSTSGGSFLIAAAQPLQDHWRVRWRLLVEGQLDTFISEAADLANALDQGLQQAADRMASAAMIQDFSGRGQALALRIHGLSEASDYGRVMQTLRQLSQTEDIQVRRAYNDAQGPILELSLQARAGEEWLRQALRVNPVLEILPVDRFSNHSLNSIVELRLRR